MSCCEHTFDRTGTDRKRRNLLQPTFIGTYASLTGRIISISLQMAETGEKSPAHSGG